MCTCVYMCVCVCVCRKHTQESSVLAKEWKSGAPPLFNGSLFFDVVVRM